MLVLTTMFINVSNNLPKTSYMKMVDVWLLFNLLYPFIVVLIHTYMDTLRNDEDREINHHGKTIQVNDENGDKTESNAVIKVAFLSLYLINKVLKVLPANAALVSVNEKVELDAQKDFYEKIEKEMGMKRSKKLNFWQNMSLIYAPLFALGFMTVYWIAGLKHADVI